jgi:hypothetical protein
MTTLTGVKVQMDVSKRPEWEPAVLAVANALNDAGVAGVEAHDVTDGSIQKDAINIRVGGALSQDLRHSTSRSG